MAPNVIPGSDGAGEVVAVGSKVTRFEKGAKVVILFMQTHLSGPLTAKVLGSGLGGTIDGTLRQYGIFNEHGLVDMPRNLSYLEAGTLSCSALTAWNALYGLKAVLPGDWVLTQGTGGVSMSALQFAKAAGARVIATTSSAAKAETLKKLGADHVINYKETPHWGDEAKKLTGGVGVDHVIEVGGSSIVTESLKSVNIGGIVTIIGWIGGPGETGPSFPQILSSMGIVRGIVVGSREQFEAMVCTLWTDCLPLGCFCSLCNRQAVANIHRTGPLRLSTSSQSLINKSSGSRTLKSKTVTNRC